MDPYIYGVLSPWKALARRPLRTLQQQSTMRHVKIRNPQHTNSTQQIQNSQLGKAIADFTGDGRREHAVADNHAGADQRQHKQDALQHLVLLQQPPDAGGGAPAAPAQRHGIAVLRPGLLGATAGGVEELVVVPGGGGAARR